MKRSAGTAAGSTPWDQASAKASSATFMGSRHKGSALRAQSRNAGVVRLCPRRATMGAWAASGTFDMTWLPNLPFAASNPSLANSPIANSVLSAGPSCSNWYRAGRHPPRLELRRLRLVHRGVSAVGRGGLSRSGFWMAALLACGPCASLSHRSGAALWSIRRGRSGWIEVTAPRRPGGREGSGISRKPPGRRDHAGPGHSRDYRRMWRLRAPGRHELDPWALQCRIWRLGAPGGRALEQAEALRLGDLTSLDALFSRYPGRRGTEALRAVLQAELAALLALTTARRATP